MEDVEVSWTSKVSRRKLDTLKFKKPNQTTPTN